MPVNYATPAADQLFPVAGVRLGVAEAEIRKKNRRDLTLVAHSFKGSSSNMGATRLALLCGQLEERAQKKQLAEIQELVIKIDDEYQMVRRLYRAERQRVSVSSYLSGN